MPIARYVSETDLRAEFERLWPRVWQVAGVAADVEHPGAYVTYEIGDDTILIVRGPDRVRAFHNVCRHRGRQLCEPGTGQLRSIRCPFHHWEWGLDGRLRNIPERETFADLPPEADLGLHEIAVALWGGLIWIHFDRSAEPLADYLGPVATRLDAYRLHDYALVLDQAVVDVACNWKLSVDANNEGYHIPAVHPELLQAYSERDTQFELFGRHSFGAAPFGAPSPSLPVAAPGELLAQLLREVGLDPTRFAEDARGARRAIQQALRARTDFDFSGLGDDQLSDYHHYTVFPNLGISLFGLRLIVSRHLPHPRDPERMTLNQLIFDRWPSGRARPPRPRPERFAHGQGSLGFVTDQDVDNYVRLQRGMRSRVVDRLVLGEEERGIRHMYEVLATYLGPVADRP
jgi:phenylpropionate dioxygenase-like ring-hydroxylating dioxygenase large terminal subunit